MLQPVVGVATSCCASRNLYVVLILNQPLCRPILCGKRATTCRFVSATTLNIAPATTSYVVLHVPVHALLQPLLCKFPHVSVVRISNPVCCAAPSPVESLPQPVCCVRHNLLWSLYLPQPVNVALPPNLLGMSQSHCADQLFLDIFGLVCNLKT